MREKRTALRHNLHNFISSKCSLVEGLKVVVMVTVLLLSPLHCGVLSGYIMFDTCILQV